MLTLLWLSGLPVDSWPLRYVALPFVLACGMFSTIFLPGQPHIYLTGCLYLKRPYLQGLSVGQVGSYEWMMVFCTRLRGRFYD